jgi:hypothetical protein
MTGGAKHYYQYKLLLGQKDGKVMKLISGAWV